MKYTRIFAGLICIFLLSSCFEDNGNYDYKDIEVNEIYIRYPVYSATFYEGDPVVFEPTITYYNEEQKEKGDTNIYKWSYHFDDLGCVCTERNMNMVVEEAELGKTYNGIVMAEDTVTGAIYSQNISFSIQSRYKVGWVILSDDAGSSKLNVVRNQNEVWYTDKDIYQKMYNTSLGTEPVKLIGNRGGRAEVRVLQNGTGGNVILSGDGIYKMLGTFEEEFIGGQYPEGFSPTNFVASGGNTVAMQGNDGKVYTKIYDRSNGNPYEFEYFVNIPLQLENKVLNAQLLQPSPSSSTYNLILYDNTFDAFFMLYGASFYNAGKLYKLKAPTDWDITKGPTPDNLSNYDVVYAQLKNASYYDQDVYSILKNKSDNNLYLYSFEYSSSSSNVFVENISYTQIEPEVTTLLDGDAKMHMLRQRPYMFFVPTAEPSTLYYYDLKTNRYVVFKSFDGVKITSIESDYRDDNTIGVGLENGMFYLLNVSEEMLISGNEDDKIIYETQVDGKIVDLFYKQY